MKIDNDTRGENAARPGAPTTPVASQVPEEITRFAAAVRAALDDLPIDVVEDLTDGLEADLVESSADRDGPLKDWLREPVAYAAEMRAAAGLQARPSPEPNDLSHRLRLVLADRWQRIRQHHVVAVVLEQLQALRPVWWVARGYGMWLILSAMSGSLLSAGAQGAAWPAHSVVGWLVLIAAVLVSCQWGQGNWIPRRPTRAVTKALVGAATTVVAIAACTGLVLVNDYSASNRSASAETTTNYVATYDTSDGVQIGDKAVTNLFVYDADGKPVPGAQIYDQDGQPVSVLTGAAMGQSGSYLVQVPAFGGDGKPLTNVYPYRMYSTDNISEVTSDPMYQVGAKELQKLDPPEPTWPFAAANSISQYLKAPATQAEPSPEGPTAPDGSAASPGATPDPNQAAPTNAPSDGQPAATPEPTPTAGS